MSDVMDVIFAVSLDIMNNTVMHHFQELAILFVVNIPTQADSNAHIVFSIVHR